MRPKTIIFYLLIIVYFVSFLPPSSSANQSTSRNDYWEKVVRSWIQVDYNPSTENSAKFYQFISRSEAEDNLGLSSFINNYLINSYRFKYEILCGNRYIAMAALRLLKLSPESQGDKITRDLSKLIRINPALFLEILNQERGLEVEKLRKLIVSLPEENEYLYKQSFLLGGNVSEKLSYFAYYEIEKRIEALEKLRSKEFPEIKQVSLDLLNKRLQELKAPISLKIDFETAVDMLKNLWSLPVEDKWLIFDRPLPGDEGNFDLNKNSYYQRVLLSLMEFESFAGNEFALRAILFDIKTSIINEKEAHLWEVSRINPGCFINGLCGFQGGKLKSFNIFSSLSFDKLSTEAKISELQYRIELFRKLNFKNKICEQTKKSYLNKFKKLEKLYCDILKKEMELKKIIGN